MQKASLDELKGQIAAGEYAVDSRVVAGDILSKFEVIRRVGRWMMGTDEAETAGEPSRSAQPRSRGARPMPARRPQSRSERPS
jgi:hypothetical protein